MRCGHIVRFSRIAVLAVLVGVQLALIASPGLATQPVRNTAPDVAGQWSPVLNWPLVAIHAELLPTGNVLMWDAWNDDGASARIWHPDSQAFVAAPESYAHLFCSGHTALADGKQLVIGGHNGSSAYGIVSTETYDPASGNWTPAANMHVARWYPSATTLSDGRVLALGGQSTPDVYAEIPEIYDPSANTWTQLPTAQLNVDEYPHVYVTPAGKVFLNAGPDGHSRALDIGSQIWTDLGVNPASTGITAMYRPGKIISAGGDSGAYGDPVRDITAVIDLNQPTPSWRQTSAMHLARSLHNLVVLPDGNVLAIGGSTIAGLTSTTGRLEAEMWDVGAEAWTTMAAMHDPRMYHSTALLLPDGRVLVAGGGRIDPAPDYLTAEIYSPPYLFKGVRPTISSAPATVTYGAAMTVQTPDAANIASVALVRLSSVTHSFNMEQRFIDLPFAAGASSLNVQSPANANLAPPGYYMLFVVNASGVPSVAKIVQVVSHVASVTLTGPPDGGTVSGTAIALAATAVTDVGVASAQFLLDGAPFGPAVTSAPYATVWNSTTATNGTHTIGAQIRDILGNAILAPVRTVTVANSPPLALATITPASGPSTGGSEVTITGSGFQSGTTVTFGSIPATAVTVVGGTTITAVTPAHGVGAVSVTAANPGGQSVTLDAGFTYGTANPLPGAKPTVPSGMTAPNPLPSAARPTAPPAQGGTPVPAPQRR